MENDATQKHAPGDLFEVRTIFRIKFSGFDLDDTLIGNKVAETMKIEVALVVANKM